VARPSNKPPFLSPATGREIKDWLWFNKYNATRYTCVAEGLWRFFNLLDDVVYEAVYDGDKVAAMIPVREV